MDVVDPEALGAGRDGGAIEPRRIIDSVARVQITAEPRAVSVGGGTVVQMPPRGRFAVIEGGRRLSAESASRPKMWLCRTCEDDIGVATSVVEPIWQGPLRESGKIRLSTGTKRLVCTHCKMRGKLTFVD